LRRGSVAFLIAIWSTLTIPTLTWGVMFDWPDYVHVNHGFPMVWATHVLSTIAGPVDVWRVDIPALLINLIFWLGSMAAGVIVIIHFSSPKRSTRSSAYEVVPFASGVS